jgi:Protein kinase domain/RDD family
MAAGLEETASAVPGASGPAPRSSPEAFAHTATVDPPAAAVALAHTVELSPSPSPSSPAPAAPRTVTSPAALAHTATAEPGAVLHVSPPALPGATLAAGRQLAHFRIERLLGAGGMGEVYLASDLALDRPVALKVVAQGSTSAARRERLIREARAQARIYHPNVCHIYYIGETDGLLFFAMELVTGQTFTERIAAGPVDPEEALELIRMAALGLREATRCGFTHRDVKPSNLMLDQHGNVKVLDFGLVAGSSSNGAAVAGAPHRSGSVEQTTMAGTPLYMAPEQARGEPIDFRADIYALGATLYHLVAGKPPFAGDTLADLLKHHSSSELPPFARKDVAARTLTPIAQLCARMMAKDPAQRHASYDDLLLELEVLSSQRSRPAGATVRSAAVAVDCVIMMPLLLGLAWLYDRVTQRDLNDMVSLCSVFALYRFATFAWLGRSFGQAIFEIEVVSMVDGRRPSRAQIARRLLWQLFLPIFALAGMIIFPDPASYAAGLPMALSPIALAFLFLHLYFASMRLSKRRTWWDRKSGTLVRYRPR